jgi:putative transcriptional regulator
MPVCLHLDRLLHERRMSLAELADRTGVSASDLAILKSGDARALRFTTLEALCRELGCQPGDILTYAPDGPTPPGAPT